MGTQDNAPTRAELRAAQDALEERSVFLAAVLDNVDVGLVACDKDGILTLFNQAARVFHGLPQEPLPASRWPEHYSLFRADGVTPLPVDEVPLMRALRGERVRNAEMMIAPNGGAARFCLASGEPLFDAAGNKLGAVVAMHDVTALRRAEEHLRQSELFLESIVENIPDMIFVKDAAELRFVRFNRAGEQLLGHPREALIGKNDYDFFPGPEADAFVAKDRAVLAGGVAVEIPEEPISTAHHGLRTLHTKKIPIVSPSGEPKYLLGISEDITVRKQVEEQKTRLLVEQAARAEAEESNALLEEERALREQFVATLSHDLRGPLGAARTSAELLRKYPDKADARERLTNRIVSSLERAERMIRDLLDAHLIRAGRVLPLQLAPCDLRTIAAEALDELTVQHGDRFVLVAPSPVPGHWNADGLRRVVENLATNAVKYGSPVTPVTVTVEALDGQARLTVHNEGTALSPEDQERLFAPFHRSRTARAGGEHGWGLGLVLVRGLAQAHGGEVAIESTAAAGTRFIVTLPLDARPAQAQEEEQR